MRMTDVQTGTGSLHIRAVIVTADKFGRSSPRTSQSHRSAMGLWLLVSAGLVGGRRLTSYWRDGVPEEIRDAGGNWVDEPVVVDGNLITSRWPPDLPAFTAEMMSQLSVRQA